MSVEILKATRRRIYFLALTFVSLPLSGLLHHPPAGPSAFLSIGRIAAFVGGSIYAGQKMGALQAEANAADLKMLAEFDLAEARKPAAERHVLGTHTGPRRISVIFETAARRRPYTDARQS
jgi:hypothetical protein